MFSFLAPVRREEVTGWAEQEAEWTRGLNHPDEPPSWKHGYVIYLKMFYEIREKWEQAPDPEKLQLLYGQLNKYIFILLKDYLYTCLIHKLLCVGTCWLYW